MKPIRLHGLARAELDEAIAAYEAQSAGLGLALEAEVSDALDLIRRYPQIGSPFKTTRFRYWPLRRFPYVLYYLDLPDKLWIAAIAHSKRRPDYWRKRRSESN